LREIIRYFIASVRTCITVDGLMYSSPGVLMHSSGVPMLVQRAGEDLHRNARAAYTAEEK
jgi:hypothetical protein